MKQRSLLQLGRSSLLQLARRYKAGQLLLIASAVGASVIGCKGYEAVHSQSTGTSFGIYSGGSSPVNMDDLHENLDQIDLAIAAIEIELSKISAQAISAGGSGFTQSIQQKIEFQFDNLLISLDSASLNINSLRTEVSARMDALNHDSPADASEITKLNDVFIYLEQVEDYLNDECAGLISKVDARISATDVQIANMNPQSPLTWAVLLNWQPIKLMLIEYSNKL